ncbi:MAG: bifunctional phosphopantothenoylcysteine decarboxylase/phosphopantothenate--cysteine ligase CoaBC [Vampirovibrio sp.]|nr:bifunctional phosphopantothenoylcysteine decarboxylase/phosphopantothenate--cysteine ligase CoaBC [Vampirovibrio sp.]
MRFDNKTIVIGICGGIAAYKVCDLIRELYRKGAERVIPILTPNATQFVTPLTLQSLSRQAVYTDGLAVTEDGTPVHIAMAQQADALLILPATANTLAKLAGGLADELVTTTFMTFTGKPVVIAPAMNTRMWDHPLTQQHCRTLKSLENVSFVDPTAGDLACGETGAGHLADMDSILIGLYQQLHPQKGLLQGIKATITAGGTKEPLDPVRLLTNQSSGKMGIALADELYAMGAQVNLVTTVTNYQDKPLSRPYTVHPVSRVREMADCLDTLFEETDLLIMAAAVSDFQPEAIATEKIKKVPGQPLHLTLTPTQDILAGLGQRKQPHQTIIGFAAETQDLLNNAEAKLKEKHADAIVANDISQPDIGMNAPDNEVTILFANEPPVRLGKAPKEMIARQILITLAEKLDGLNAKRSKATLSVG